ncbi:spermidine/putrescine ABC transporter substrate-binding protein [Ureibacillus massiliensis 4400831 = CIP 108448 = CCUG 49529]|uniref:Spermidine/putrescine ABC transporter substrate-binding protein n=1 Tax=Ureibacillus massiliensis 4400831 = CIP 108448 = CCUG 49529 TaxID=1211035 RepID=A0A0A3J8Y5_9BACL|nr:spermidine/putrescine ABC transporter substrate-binding protein [Ureibacillus massiliensis]KGR92230.1 spermidine/putrescine ABC transporter substrate-binding protein [Ureibacillus massiliensis 4400831 = CIP 108448 = CCUG 49529]RKJ51291.1 spermidine/putrescine ABC transporter substrate-binding protein [Butyricicoccus sp. 1XD8-22]
MKSLIQSAIAIIVVCTILLFTANQLEAGGTQGSNNTITVYNWGEYIDPELIDQFTEETGIKVIYETFDSNEAMMTKVQQGGSAYDVAVPSEYMVEMMIEEDLLIPLDHSKLPNMKNIDPYFLDLAFDPGNKYTIPYFWGTVGIVYNPSLVEDHLTFESWKDLWDPSLKDKVFLVDGAREVMGMGLNSLGESLNAKDDNLLRQATDKLITLSPNIKAIIGDEITPLMINNEATVALTWSGQAADMMWENEELDFAVPQEGSNLWFDNFVIPKTAANVDGAHAFINFMLDAEVSAQNNDYVGYSTPNAAAMELMDPEVIEDERFYPNEELREKLEVYENLGLEWLGKYNEYFLEFKMSIR